MMKPKISVCFGILAVLIALIGLPSPSRAQQVVRDTAQSLSLLSRGMNERARGNAPKAIEALKSAISYNDQNDAAYFELARLQLEQGATGDAAINAKKAAGLDPENEWYWLLLTDVYKQMEDFASLPPIYEKLIALKPAQKELYFDKAYAEFLSKDYEASLRSYAKIEREFGDSDNLLLARQNVYVAQGDSQKAIDELNNLIKSKPKDNKGYILLSNLYLKLGDTKQAMQVLDKAEKKMANDPYIAISRTDVYHAENKQDKALSNLKKVFSADNLDVDSKLNILARVVSDPKLEQAQLSSIEDLANMLTTKYPNAAVAFSLYGDILYQAGKHDLALMQYARSVEIDPNQNRVWEQLLQMELTGNKVKEAAAHANQAVVSFPDSPITQFFAGHAFLMNKEHEKARTSFESALDNADERNTALMAQIYSSLGDTYHALKLFKESDLAYSESLALEPDNAGVLNNYAYYLAIRKENLEKADSMSSRSLVLEPGNETFEDTYAWVLFQLGRYDEALVWIEKAVSNSEHESVTLLEHYGDILSKAGNTKEAVIKWESALELAEKNNENTVLLKKKIDAQGYIE